MNEKLHVKLTIPYDCRLIATDYSPYWEWGVDLTNHVSVEFILFNKETEVNYSRVVTNVIESDIDYHKLRNGSVFSLVKDGIWHYYKLVIPFLEHLFDDNSGKYNVENETFIYNGQFYIGPENTTGINKMYTIEEAISSSKPTDDFIELYEKNGSQTFIFKQSIISACHLQKCLLNLQKRLVQTQTNSCDFSSCAKSQELKNKCDFVLSALAVLDYLKDINNFTEAQRLIDNISTCESICGDDISHSDFNSCGCGNSV